MDYSIFYSWQADIPNKLNRSFIFDSLDKAVRCLKKEANIDFDMIVDRDTRGLHGSPSILDSIISKISKSDVFVGDITFINKEQGGRLLPNPNVLFELGYASAILGWDRIILVQNTAFGGPDLLPFDLRGRRVYTYCLGETEAAHKPDLRKKLKEQFILFFKGVLKVYTNEYYGKDIIIWWGQWELITKRKAHGGILNISRASSVSFIFSIDIFDGARSGSVKGRASIITPHSAIAVLSIDEFKACKIIFRRRKLSEGWVIDVEVNQECSYFHGHGTTFGGVYKYLIENAVDHGCFDELDLNEIARVTGEQLQLYLNNFQQICRLREGEFDIVTGGIKGLYTIMESIFVRDDFGTIWCACLDLHDKGIIRYFSNASSPSLKPDPLKQWLDRFPERALVVDNC